MKIKSFILTGILTAAMVSMPVFAEPETSDETQAAATSAVTEREAVTNVTETETTVLSSAAETTTTAAVTTTQSFYDQILEYVGDDNGPVLDNNLENNALTINQSTIDYSDKSMYTITTRSGDVFYLIVNSSDGSVYFLNAVDTADLTAMLSNSSSSDNQLNENALESIEEIEESTTVPIEETKDSETANGSNGGKKSFYKSNLMLLLGGFVVMIIVVAAAIFIKRRHGNGNYGYDDDFSDDDFQPQDPSNIISYAEAEKGTDNSAEDKKEEKIKPNVQDDNDGNEEFIDIDD